MGDINDPLNSDLINGDLVLDGNLLPTYTNLGDGGPPPEPQGSLTGNTQGQPPLQGQGQGQGQIPGQTNTGTSVRLVLGGLIGSAGGAKGGSGMIGSSARGTDRFILREAFGNHRPAYASGYSFLNFPTSRTTPFRRAYNAGDAAGTYNESPSSSLPGSNQLNGRAGSILNIKTGGVHNDGGALFSGNPKYVYDGSDYTRYKKLKAMNKTYNDYSFGGANNGSYVALKRTRH